MGFIKYSKANLDLVGEEKPDWAMTQEEVLAKKAKLDSELPQEKSEALENSENAKENKT